MLNQQDLTEMVAYFTLLSKEAKYLCDIPEDKHEAAHIHIAGQCEEWLCDHFDDFNPIPTTYFDEVMLVIKYAGIPLRGYADSPLIGVKLSQALLADACAHLAFANDLILRALGNSCTDENVAYAADAGIQAERLIKFSKGIMNTDADVIFEY